MIRNRLNNLKLSFKHVILDYWSALLICPALFLYIFSNDINLIALNGLVYRKICLREFNLTICDSIRNFSNYSNHVQEISSQKLLILNVSFLIPAIFAIIYLASIGDRRLNYQLPLLVSLIGSIGQAFINIFASDQPYLLCFNLLIISQILNGLCGGGSLAFISSCFSHVSLYEEKLKLRNNLIENENEIIQYRKNHRSIRYSLCESCLLLGQFLGSFLSGYLIGNKIDIAKFKQTYIISFSIYLLVFVYTVIMFKYLKYKYDNNRTQMSLDTASLAFSRESILNLDENKIQLQINSLKTSQRFVYLKKNLSFLLEIWNLLKKRRENNARFQIISLLVLFFFGSSISLGIISLQYLYLIKKPISMNQIDYGIYRALNTLCRAISLLFILPVLKHFFNLPDYYLFIIGLTSEFLNLVVFSLASFYKYIIWLGPVCYMFSNYYVVCIRSYASKLVNKTETGKFFGLIGVVEFLVLLTSSSVFSTIYKHTVSSFPSLVFLLGCAICVFVCYPFLVYVIRDLKKYQAEEQQN